MLHVPYISIETAIWRPFLNTDIQRSGTNWRISRDKRLCLVVIFVCFVASFPFFSFRVDVWWNKKKIVSDNTMMWLFHCLFAQHKNETPKITLRWHRKVAQNDVTEKN